VPFLDALAAEWLHRAGSDPLAVSRGLILVPTRRAARALAEAFLRASGGRPLLLPRITALGALDEAPLTLAGALDQPPAVEPAQRLAALTLLILKMQGANGAPRTADRAWPLAA
jgi:ATP-dependent helicase/nuclease subunit B